MLHELWEDPANEGLYTFCLSGPRGNDARASLSPIARMVWTVEAPSHYEAMTLYYNHQGWGTYTTDQAWDRQTYESIGWELDGRPVDTDWVIEFTRKLREGDPAQGVVRLRRLLAEFGINPQTAVLAAWFPDGPTEEFAVVLTDGGGVHGFVIDTESPAITLALDLTERWKDSHYRRDVLVARIAFPDGPGPS